MQPEEILILADALREYFGSSELMEVAALFDVKIEDEAGGVEPNPSHLRTARAVGEHLEHGNNRRFVHAVIAQAIARCEERVAHTDWERRSYHQSMYTRLNNLRNGLGEAELPSEITVPEDRPFTAKSEAREFVGKADTPVLIVDPYIGVGTLDCLRDVQRPIRILTGDRQNSIEQGFQAALAQFRGEGYTVDVRAHPKLHDRYLLFNERCWLAGSSLKDAGKKTFSMIELVDGRPTIVAEMEKKWLEATPVS